MSDAPYCTRSHGRSSVASGFIAYLGNDVPTEINGAINVLSSVIQNVMASIGEAKYAASFHNAQMVAGLCKTLSDLGYPQPPTYYILVDNKGVHAMEISPATQSNLGALKVLTCNSNGYVIVFVCKNS